jgi:hypothetical protein
VPIVFCDTRQLAEEWTYRYLAAALAWATTETDIGTRLDRVRSETDAAPAAPEPSTKVVRAWAREQGWDVPDRGRLRPEVCQAWRDAH